MPGGGDALRYAYDEENRLIEVRSAQTNALLAQYAYDALGRRVQTLDYTSAASSPCLNTSSPLITRHLMAGLQTLEETVHCTLAAGSSGALLVREFVWGDRFPEPVAMITHGSLAGPSAPSATSVYYYLPDILGSVLALADAAGNVVERYSYDPYGRTAIERHETGGAWTATAASSFGNPFAWTGQRYDAPVGLYHFLFRSYSPTLGRWLQRDPADYAGGANLLEYVASDPTNRIDPFGLLDVFIWYLKFGVGVGHASMRLKDGTYISWWPVPKDGKDKSKPRAPAHLERTLDEDSTAEQRPPDVVIHIEGLDEEAIKRWWEEWKKNLIWDLGSRNCSNNVSEGIKAGGGHSLSTGCKLVWTPFDVELFAKRVKKKREEKKRREQRNKVDVKTCP